MYYHRKSIRLNSFDYSKNGYYFVTICAWKRLEIFGKIIDNKMVLNNAGEIIKNELIKTEKIRKNVKIDVFQIMPNHVHLIIKILENNNSGVVVGAYDNPDVKVGAYCNTPLQNNKFQSPKNNLGSIIRGLKSTICKQINERLSICLSVWQRNYYEHIIKNESEYLKIKEYIELNPLIWDRDRNNPKNIFNGINNYAKRI